MEAGQGGPPEEGAPPETWRLGGKGSRAEGLLCGQALKDLEE